MSEQEREADAKAEQLDEDIASVVTEIAILIKSINDVRVRHPVIYLAALMKVAGRVVIASAPLELRTQLMQKAIEELMESAGFDATVVLRAIANHGTVQ